MPTKKPTEAVTHREFLSRRLVAAMLGFTEQTLRSLRKADGDFPEECDDGFRISELNEWIEAQRRRT